MFDDTIGILAREERLILDLLPGTENSEMRQSMLRFIAELQLARNYLAGKRDSQAKLNSILSELAKVRKRNDPMDSKEQAAFSELSARFDTLSATLNNIGSGVTKLVGIVSTEAEELKAALAANDTAGVLAAAAAISAKVDSQQIAAQTIADAIAVATAPAPTPAPEPVQPTAPDAPPADG